ncbi:MAG: hypothetical protein PPFGHCPK_01111 [Spiroplasma endosymbiont of Drosophila atripex]|nr:MAG: hypothetical protein PPFGHCPK_01111 [Spiroplasma endosymbiont of Drosophila atripex]
MIFNFKNWFNNSFRSDGKKIIKQKGDNNTYNEINYEEKWLNAEKQLKECQKSLEELEKFYQYHEFPLNKRFIIGDELSLDRILIEKKIDYQRIYDYKNFDFIIYKINKANWIDFNEIIKKFEEEQMRKQEMARLQIKLKNQSY